MDLLNKSLKSTGSFQSINDFDKRPYYLKVYLSFSFLYGFHVLSFYILRVCPCGPRRLQSVIPQHCLRKI